MRALRARGNPHTSRSRSSLAVMSEHSGSPSSSGWVDAMDDVLDLPHPLASVGRRAQQPPEPPGVEETKGKEGDGEESVSEDGSEKYHLITEPSEVHRLATENRLWLQDELDSSDFHRADKVCPAILKSTKMLDCLAQEDGKDYYYRLSVEEFCGRLSKCGPGSFCGLHARCKTEPRRMDFSDLEGQYVWGRYVSGDKALLACSRAEKDAIIEEHGNRGTTNPPTPEEGEVAPPVGGGVAPQADEAAQRLSSEIENARNVMGEVDPTATPARPRDEAPAPPPPPRPLCPICSTAYEPHGEPQHPRCYRDYLCPQCGCKDCEMAKIEDSRAACSDALAWLRAEAATTTEQIDAEVAAQTSALAAAGDTGEPEPTGPPATD